MPVPALFTVLLINRKEGQRPFANFRGLFYMLSVVYLTTVVHGSSILGADRVIEH